MKIIGIASGLLTCLLLLPAAISIHASQLQPAPAFDLPHLYNDSLFGPHDFKGRAVLIDFWATWCAPCRKSLPELEKVAARHSGATVVTVNLDGDKGKARGFLKGKAQAMIPLYDGKQIAAKAYAIEGMPAAFLIDKSGNLWKRFDGYTENTLQEMEAELEKLMLE